MKKLLPTSSTSRVSRKRSFILSALMLVMLLLTTGARGYQPLAYDLPNPHDVAASTGLPYKVTLTWQVGCDARIDHFDIAAQPAGGGGTWTLEGRQDYVGCDSTSYEYSWDFMLDGMTNLAFRDYQFKITPCPELGGYCDPDDASSIVTGSGIISPPYISATDGTFDDRVEVSFFEYAGFNSRSYKVFRSTSSSGIYTSLGYTTGDGTIDGIYEDTSVTPGTTYYYKGQICNLYGCSELSTNHVSGFASASGPSGIEASDGTVANYIQVNWEPVDGAAFYRLYRSETDSLPAVDDYYVDSIHSTGYQDVGVGVNSVDPYTTYYYWVRAFTTTWSAAAGPDTGWRPYETVHNIDASDGDNVNTIDITWAHDDEEITYYSVYRSLSSDPDTAASIGSSTTTSFTDSTGQAGTIYYYWIKSCDDANRCGELAGPDTGYSRVADVTNIAASDGTSTAHVALNWDSVYGVDGYKVYRHTSNVATPSNVIGSPTDASFEDTTATPGVDYYYWVKGCGADYCSSATNSDTGWRAVSSPGNVSATDGTSTDHVTISWDSVDGADSYNVYRAASEGGARTQIVGTLLQSFNDTTAVPGTTYYYWLRAYTVAHGNSAYSDNDTGWRGLTAPTGLTASDGLYDQIDLDWDDHANADHYEVYRSDSESGMKSLLESNAATSAYTDSSGTPGQTYYYWVKGFNGSNGSDFSSHDTGWMRGGTLPEVSSITRVDSTPTNAANVSFLVTFSEDVSGVDSTDFDLTVSGLTGASVNSVTGSGSTRTVSVYTGSGSGTLRLDVDDDNTIVDDIQNHLGGGTEGDGDFTTGEVYDIDKEAPAFLEVHRYDPASEITNADTLVFRVVFSELVQNVDAADFDVSGGTTAEVTAVQQLIMGNFDVTVSGGDLAGYNGTVWLYLDAGQDITDPAGNAQQSQVPAVEEYYAVDNSVPVVSSITRKTTSSPTNSSVVYFEVVFSSDVSGVDAFDFNLVTTGLSAVSIDWVLGSGDTYTVSVNTGTGDGTIRLDTADDDSITDAAGNQLGGAGAGNGDYSDGETYVIDRTGPSVIIAARAVPGASSVIVEGASTFLIEFNEAVLHNGHDLAANNPLNYLLFQAGPNGVFEAASCAEMIGPHTFDDVVLPVGPAVYSDGGGSGPFQVTLTVNNAAALPLGEYRLHICGTTSIADLAGNELNDGASDAVVDLNIVQAELPETGFAPSVPADLPSQPEELAYQSMDGMWLDIPLLGVHQPIVGVPVVENAWDLTWLGNNIGYLDGTAYPTWSGNTALTAHVYTADGLPGPFAELDTLQWGDRVSIHTGGQQAVYEVRSVSRFTDPRNATPLTRHEDLDWVTLITCRGYDEATGGYRWRTVVRAVRIGVE